MNRKSDQPAEGLGLMASGSSGRWSIDVDESLDRDVWFLEIDGPVIYLNVQIHDLAVISKALRFLESGPRSWQKPGGRDNDERSLTLGRFGSAPVSLLWDNEDFPRCFLVIGPEAGSTLRLSLLAEDIRMIAEALDQVVSDLPGAAGG